jgi:hypothetical protein
MKRLFRSAVPSLLLGAGLLFLGLACEDDPSTDLDTMDEFRDNKDPTRPLPSTSSTLDIEASETTVKFIGQLIALRVYGGSPPYRWTVANSTFGDFEPSPGTGDSATYKAKTVSPNTVQVTDSAGHRLTVEFSLYVPAFTVYPSLVDIEAKETNGVASSIQGQIVVFRVTGGVPPYGTWMTSTPARGVIVSQRMDVAWYQVKVDSLGDNFVSVTDSAGSVKDAKVTTRYNDGK